MLIEQSLDLSVVAELSTQDSLLSKVVLSVTPFGITVVEQ